MKIYCYDPTADIYIDVRTGKPAPKGIRQEQIRDEWIGNVDIEGILIARNRLPLKLTESFQ